MEVKNLSVLIKDRFLVKNTNFTMEDGECIGVIGQDKSGKTSLLKAVSGSLPISAGQVFIDGHDIFRDKKILTKVSTCFDPPIFFKYQTVLANMKYISMLSEAYNKEDIIKVLNKFNLAQKLHTRVLFLSYFEKKLMGLALGLLTKPKLLLLDEPYKNLPPEHLEMVKNAIKQIRENGTAVIMTTRDLDTILDECDRFMFMENRAVKEILTKEECEKKSQGPIFAFIKVKYPHYVGKLIMENFDLHVKLQGQNVLFQADEDITAKIVHFLNEKKLAVYRAGYLSKKAEKIFANLTPFFKEETE